MEQGSRLGAGPRDAPHLRVQMGGEEGGAESTAREGGGKSGESSVPKAS